MRLVMVLVVLGAVTSLAVASDGDLLSREPVLIDAGVLLEGVDEDRKEGLQTMLGDIEASAVLERIVYQSDGLKVRGYLALPKTDGRHSAIILNRGGNRDFGALDDLRAALLMGRLARRGYLVVASQYRGNGGGEGQEEFGGSDVRDVLNLIPLLEGLPAADAARIGMYGWSRGGMMTYLALKSTGRMRAAVIGAGVSDAFDMVKRRPEMEEHVLAEVVPNWAEQREAALTARSAILWPEKLHKQTPILILHGTGDWRVHPSQSLRMASALLEARHPYRLMIFEGGDHGLTEFRNEVDAAVADWFDRYLRDGASWPSLEPHGR